MNLKLFKIFFCLLFLNSCLINSNYYNSRISTFLESLRPVYRPQVFDGVLEPSSIPDLDLDQSTLLGIDLNKDGVRDDLEIFINRNFSLEIERTYLKNGIRRSPDFFRNFNKMNLEDFVKYESSFDAEFDCIYHGIPLLELNRSEELAKFQMSSAIYNTRKRLDAYKFFTKQLKGRTFGIEFSDKSIIEKCYKKIDLEVLSKKTKAI